MSRFLMSRFLLVLVLLPELAATVSAHELPDGEVERRVQIVVKPDVVLIEYSLAMNEATLAKEIHRLGEEPAEELAEKWHQYRQVMLPQLPKHIRVIVDGERVALHAVRADYTGWSHVHLSCLLKAEIKLTEKRASILVSDANFPKTPGQYRIAMKGRSGAMVNDATVPPIISRAKPVALVDLTEEQKTAATKAIAEVMLDRIDNAKQEGFPHNCR